MVIFKKNLKIKNYFLKLIVFLQKFLQILKKILASDTMNYANIFKNKFLLEIFFLNI